jgi:hypothetical protein
LRELGAVGVLDEHVQLDIARIHGTQELGQVRTGAGAQRRHRGRVDRDAQVL